MVYRFAFVALAALAVGGCGAAAVIQQHDSEVAQSTAQGTEQFKLAGQKCDADWNSSADVNPIRDKVSSNVSASIPVRLLVINQKPNQAEKKALLALSAIREKCSAYLHETIAAVPLPASMDPNLQVQVRAGFNAYADWELQGGNYLIAMLYNGQITFGEYNRRRKDFHETAKADLIAWAQVIDAQDRAAMLQKAEAAQKATEAAVAILQAAACASARGRTAAALCS